MTHSEHREWRAKEVNKVGVQVQMQAESKIEREKGYERVRVADDSSGEYKEIRVDVAEVMVRKNQNLSYAPKKSYYIP